MIVGVKSLDMTRERQSVEAPKQPAGRRSQIDGERTRLVPTGTFDLAHASAVVRAEADTIRIYFKLIGSDESCLSVSEYPR